MAVNFIANSLNLAETSTYLTTLHMPFIWDFYRPWYPPRSAWTLVAWQLPEPVSLTLPAATRPSTQTSMPRSRELQHPNQGLCNRQIHIYCRFQLFNWPFCLITSWCDWTRIAVCWRPASDIVRSHCQPTHPRADSRTSPSRRSPRWSLARLRHKYLKTLAYKLRLTYLGLIYFVSFRMVVRIADVQKLLLIIGEEGQVWNELLFKYCSEIDLNPTDPYASPPGLVLSQWSAM